MDKSDKTKIKKLQSLAARLDSRSQKYTADLARMQREFSGVYKELQTIIDKEKLKKIRQTFKK